MDLYYKAYFGILSSALVLAQGCLHFWGWIRGGFYSWKKWLLFSRIMWHSLENVLQYWCVHVCILYLYMGKIITVLFSFSCDIVQTKRPVEAEQAFKFAVKVCRNKLFITVSIKNLWCTPSDVGTGYIKQAFRFSRSHVFNLMRFEPLRGQPFYKGP